MTQQAFVSSISLSRKHLANCPDQNNLYGHPAIFTAPWNCTIFHHEEFAPWTHEEHKS